MNMKRILTTAAVFCGLCMGAHAYDITGVSADSAYITQYGTETGQTAIAEGKFEVKVPTELLVEGNSYIVLVTDGEVTNNTASYSLTDSAITYIDQYSAADFSGTVTVYPKSVSSNFIVLLGGVFENELTSPVVIGSYSAPYTLGDVNDDGNIDSVDAMLTLQFYVESRTPTDTQKVSADVDHDTEITPQDAMLVLQYYVEKINAFPTVGGK